MTWRSTTLRFALLVFALQIAAAVALLGITRVVVRKQIDDGAAMRTALLREDLLVTFRQAGLRRLVASVRARTDGAVVDSVLVVADRRGRVLAGNLADWPPGVRAGATATSASLYRRDHAVPEAMRVQATALGGGARLLTGSVVEGEERLVRYLEAAALAGLSIALVFAALAAWLTTRIIVGRLRTTVATLQAVRDGDLGRRVEPDGTGDAFAALSDAVNVTLDRVDAVVGELKIATDGLAHDLRSPLTRQRSALERVALDVHEPVARQALDRALAEGERLLAIVETAQRISRAEAGIGRDSFVTVDIAAELDIIAEIYGPVAEEAGGAILVDASPGVRLPVHRELLGQALGNLVDNALKYGAGAITLRARSTPEAVVISVEDHGEGIAPELRDRALRRFGRLDAARGQTGAGLGLSLVAAVARLHGGVVSLEDAGPGLAVRLVLGPAGLDLD